MPFVIKRKVPKQLEADVLMADKSAEKLKAIERGGGLVVVDTPHN